MERGGGGGGGGGAAPTGCYKCGRPGHWSRDCPSANLTSDKNNDYNNNKSAYPRTTPYQASRKPTTAAEKPKKVPRSRPKLTPDLLLSDDGFGHILRHFPRGFKFRGRGHEVDDLGHLLGMYAEWNSKLIPYYPFDQFVHKVEEVCTTKRVKLCIRQLREKVMNGADATMLDQSQVQQEISSHEQDNTGLEQLDPFHEDTSFDDPHADKVQEKMLLDMLENEPEEPSNDKIDTVEKGCVNKEASSKSADNVDTSCSVIQLSEEQRARMEANRVKALERAATRARSLNNT